MLIDQQRNGAASRAYRAEVAWRFGRSAEHATVSRGYITRYGRAADATALEIYYPFGIAQDRFMIVDTYGINLRFFKSLWWGIARPIDDFRLLI